MARTASVRPSVLLFDLGGVLIENPGFDNFSRLLPEAPTREALKDGWLKSSAVRRFETGRSSPQEFANEFVAEWQISMAPEEFLAQFESWPKQFSSESLALVRMLRRDFRVACLSNSNELHWQRFAPYQAEFDVALSSHLMGVVKPDAEAFSLALLRCGAAPDEVLYFDDSLANVHAARAAGIRTLHVEGLPEVIGSLRQEGLY